MSIFDFVGAIVTKRNNDNHTQLFIELCTINSSGIVGLFINTSPNYGKEIILTCLSHKSHIQQEGISIVHINSIKFSKKLSFGDKSKLMPYIQDYLSYLNKCLQNQEKHITMCLLKNGEYKNQTVLIEDVSEILNEVYNKLQGVNS